MQNRGLHAESPIALRPHARKNGGLLQLFLQRFGEVVVGHLKVVLRRDGLGVADPLTDDVHGEVFGEFRLPRAAEVLEKLGPALQTGPLRAKPHTRLQGLADLLPDYGQQGCL